MPQNYPPFMYQRYDQGCGGHQSSVSCDFVPYEDRPVTPETSTSLPILRPRIPVRQFGGAVRNNWLLGGIQGLSFLALIVLSGKLYEVDRQVRFLTVVLTEWFPTEQPKDPSAVQRPPPVQSNIPRSGPPLIQPVNPQVRPQQPQHPQQQHPGHTRVGRASTELPSSSYTPAVTKSTNNVHDGRVNTIPSEDKGTPISTVPSTSPGTTQVSSSAGPVTIPVIPVNDTQNKNHSSGDSNSIPNDGATTVTARPETLPVAVPADLSESQSLPQMAPPMTRPPTRLQVYVANLKSELHFYALEMASARTTLILSVVFVLIFILSYWWMAFAIKQARENGSVSLRTILLLSVFAAVDIAASAGFVLLRIILYIRRDRLYPFQMRIPSIAAEYDQLAAYAALRMTTMGSCCGNADVLVSIVVGFLTGLRVYSVVCVFSYYRKAKNGATDTYQKTNYVAGSEAPIHNTLDSRADRLKDMDDYVPRPLIINYPKKHHQPQHSGPPLSAVPPSRTRSRLSSMTATGSTDDEEQLTDLKIQAADMPPDMQKTAVQSATQAIRLYSTEKHIAESIKQDFDNMYNPTWHCIVGRNWGSCVTHSKQCYIRLIYKDLTILLYKST